MRTIVFKIDRLESALAISKISFLRKFEKSYNYNKHFFDQSKKLRVYLLWIKNRKELFPISTLTLFYSFQRIDTITRRKKDFGFSVFLYTEKEIWLYTENKLGSLLARDSGVKLTDATVANEQTAGFVFRVIARRVDMLL